MCIFALFCCLLAQTYRFRPAEKFGTVDDFRDAFLFAVGVTLLC